MHKSYRIYSILTTMIAVCTVLLSNSHAQVYEKVFSFTDTRTAEVANSANKGFYPSAPLLQARDGNLYGSTIGGGSGSLTHGTIFRMTPSGSLLTLVELTNNGTTNKGRNPLAQMIQGIDGSFYGSTAEGGASGAGTIFRMTVNGALTTLVEFTGTSGANKGSSISSRLVQLADGTFYGTTAGGGTGNFGTIFRLTIGGGLTTLVEFTDNGTLNKGRNPSGDLVQGPDGNLYGTTRFGGSDGSGTIFRVTTAGTLTTLVQFPVNGLAVVPEGLLLGSDGSFYGVSSGVIFRMTTAGSVTTIAQSSNESFQSGRLVQRVNGDIYGTTYNGGAEKYGTVFRITPSGAFSTLVEFTRNGATNKGRHPRSGLIHSADGNFYGTTENGGTGDFGTVYRMTADGSVTTLVQFTGNGATTTGEMPSDGLVQGVDGCFYGTTAEGGLNPGTIFKISPEGTLKTLIAFTGPSGENRGTRPGKLIHSRNGNFYGTTFFGGNNDFGTIFKMTPEGRLTTLVDFTENGATNKGHLPQPLIEGSDSNFYGTTSLGGPTQDANGTTYGTVFKMTPEGNLTTMVNFTKNGSINKGSLPLGPLVEHDDGSFYGTTLTGGNGDFGTAFRITSTGTLTTLVQFTNNGASNKGSLPRGVIKGIDGNLYGTTFFGGASDLGTIFKMTPAGELTTLVEFTGNGSANKGSYPASTLLQGSDGRFYGTTTSGGANNRGTIFSMTITGILTTHYDYVGDAIEINPQGIMLESTDGNIYGTVASGGNAAGAIFRLVVTGAPTIVSLPPEVGSDTSAVLKAMVNARGSQTSVTLEYGTDGTSFPSSEIIASNRNGFQTFLAGTTLGGLIPFSTYYYRFRAESTSGITVSSVKSFSTLVPPLPQISAPSDLSPTSAQLRVCHEIT